MRINIRGSDRCNADNVEVEPHLTVAELRAQLARRFNVDTDSKQLLVMYRDRRLADHNTLAFCNVVNGSSVTVVVVRAVPTAGMSATSYVSTALDQAMQRSRATHQPPQPAGTPCAVAAEASAAAVQDAPQLIQQKVGDAMAATTATTANTDAAMTGANAAMTGADAAIAGANAAVADADAAIAGANAAMADADAAIAGANAAMADADAVIAGANATMADADAAIAGANAAVADADAAIAGANAAMADADAAIAGANAAMAGADAARAAVPATASQPDHVEALRQPPPLAEPHAPASSAAQQEPVMRYVLERSPAVVHIHVQCTPEQLDDLPARLQRLSAELPVHSVEIHQESVPSRCLTEEGGDEQAFAPASTAETPSTSQSLLRTAAHNVGAVDRAQQQQQQRDHEQATANGSDGRQSKRQTPVSPRSAAPPLFPSGTYTVQHARERVMVESGDSSSSSEKRRSAYVDNDDNDTHNDGDEDARRDDGADEPMPLPPAAAATAEPMSREGASAILPLMSDSSSQGGQLSTQPSDDWSMMEFNGVL